MSCDCDTHLSQCGEKMGKKSVMLPWLGSEINHCALKGPSSVEFLFLILENLTCL